MRGFNIFGHRGIKSVIWLNHVLSISSMGYCGPQLAMYSYISLSSIALFLYRSLRVIIENNTLYNINLVFRLVVWEISWTYYFWKFEYLAVIKYLVKKVNVSKKSISHNIHNHMQRSKGGLGCFKESQLLKTMINWLPRTVLHGRYGREY